LRNQALIIIAAILFSGCLFRQTVFQKAQFLMNLQIDSTFNLNSSQEDFVKKELSSFLTSLSKSEIPNLQGILKDASRSLLTDVSQQEIEVFFERWNEIYTRAMIRASNPVGQFLYTLQPEQRARLKNENEKKNREKQKALSEGFEKYNETRKRKLISQISTWIGDLNRPQLNAVSEFSQLDFDWSKRELSARKRSQEILLNSLHEAKDPHTLSQLFLQQQTAPYSQLDPEHNALRLERRKQWIQLITTLARNVSPGQRTFFERESESLSADLALIGANAD